MIHHPQPQDRYPVAAREPLEFRRCPVKLQRMARAACMARIARGRRQCAGCRVWETGR